MTNKTDQAELVEILTMSPVRPFPDDSVSINRILAYLGKNQDQISFESGVARPTVTGFISGSAHSPRVALWFEKHGIYLDRDYPDPAKSLKLLDRVGA